MKINTLIRKLREQRGLTQNSLARILNMERSTYTKIENGSTSLDFTTLLHISRKLGVPVSEMVKDDDVIFQSISEELSFMLQMTEEDLSTDLLKIIPYEELTEQHIIELKKQQLDSKEKYEEHPLGGRIYSSGPRDIFAYMMNVFRMDVLFRQKLIVDPYWLDRWSIYLQNQTQKMRRLEKLSENGWAEDLEDSFQIDTAEYFTVFTFALYFENSEEKWIQLAAKHFPNNTDEFGALEYLKVKYNACDGEIISSCPGGYTPTSDLIDYGITYLDGHYKSVLSS